MANRAYITFRPISDEVSDVERSVYSYIYPCFAAVSVFVVAGEVANFMLRGTSNKRSKY